MMLFLWGVLPVLAFIGMIAYLLWKISGGIDFFCKSISKKKKENNDYYRACYITFTCS